MKLASQKRWPHCALALVVLLLTCSGCHTFHGWPIAKSYDADKDVESRQWLKETAPTEKDAPRADRDSEVLGVRHVDRSESSAESDSMPTKSESVLKLKISEAVTRALDNNMHLRVVSNLSEVGLKQTEIERAQFDPTFNANMQYLQGTQQVASALQAVQGGQSQYGTTSVGATPGSPNLLSLEQRFSTGTVARIGLGSNYNNTSPVGQYLLFNPAYQTAGSMVIEQALFRGASRDANMVGIHIAEAGQKQTAAEFQVEVNQTLSELQRAYWRAWLAESQLSTSQEFVDLAETTSDLERKRLEVGNGGIVPSALATEHLHSLKAELAQAQQRDRAAKNRLYSLMGTPIEEQQPLQLADKPVAEVVLPDLQQGLATAASLRPEIQVRQFQIQQAQLEVDRRKNNEQADVRAYAGYSMSGLNNSLLGSVDQFSSVNFGTMTMGLRYNYVFGQRAVKAAVNQAQLALVRQLRARQETEFVIKQQVRDAYDGVKSTYEILASQQSRVAAARVQTETLNHLYDAGQVDLDRVLRARQQFSNAVQASQTALVDYNLALCDWQLAIGTMTVPVSTYHSTTDDRETPTEIVHDELPKAPAATELD